MRANVSVKEVIEKNPNQYLITYTVALEIEGVDKPALVAEWLTMLFTG